MAKQKVEKTPKRLEDYEPGANREAVFQVLKRVAKTPHLSERKRGAKNGNGEKDT